MKLRLEGGLLYGTVELTYRNQTLSLTKVILDTGSAATVFAVDEVFKLGLRPEPIDPLHRVRGIGGTEFVFSKQLDRLAVGAMALEGFTVQIGAMDYGFPLQGLIGLDFLLQAGAVIDLKNLEIRNS